MSEVLSFVHKPVLKADIFHYSLLFRDRGISCNSHSYHPDGRHAQRLPLVSWGFIHISEFASFVRGIPIVQYDCQILSPNLHRCHICPGDRHHHSPVLSGDVDSSSYQFPLAIRTGLPTEFDWNDISTVSRSMRRSEVFILGSSLLLSLFISVFDFFSHCFPSISLRFFLQVQFILLNLAS